MQKNDVKNVTVPGKFPYKMTFFHKDKKLPKCCTKCTIFFSIAYGNVKTFSMNFGFKILSDSGVPIHQTFEFSFLYTKMNIFHTFEFEGL